MMSDKNESEGLPNFDLNNKLRKDLSHIMKPDPIALKNALKKREAELQNIIRQMKQDKLHSSPVYKNLEQELQNVKSSLSVEKNPD